MNLHVITVPYRYDRFEEGQGLGPRRILESGLADQATVIHQAALDEAERDEDRTAVNIGRLGHSTAALVAEARASGERVLVVAGDDTATVGIVAGIQQSDGAGRSLGIVWFDAHGDFNTPDTSYSGILAGMPLAVIAGLAGPRWREAAELGLAVPGEQMLLIGTRDLDKAEDELLQAQGAHRLSADEARNPGAVENQLARLTARCDLLYVNIDLDVLDPHFVPSATTPSPGGLDVDELTTLVGAVLATGLVAVISVTSLNPGGGARGRRSTESAWQLLQGILGDWHGGPQPPVGAS